MIADTPDPGFGLSFLSMRPVCTIAIVGLLVSPVLAEPPDGYYAPASGLTGPELRIALHEIINDHTRLPYTSSQPDTWDAIHLADEAPGDPSRILDIYRNRTFHEDDHWSSSNTKGWNREHSWPRSYGFTVDGDCNYPFTDVHHLFASDPDYNEARGNIPYDWAPSGSEAFPVDGPGFANYRFGRYESGSWEVWPWRRGDLARAMFYMDVRYEGGRHGLTGCAEPDLRLTDQRSDFVWSASQNLSVAYMGMLSTLVEWHLEDPPDERERRRNDVVFQFQGNRNPFVDHPAFVCAIWACVLPDTDAPSAPRVAEIRGNRRSITFAWHPSPEPDVSGYRVYRRSGGVSYEEIATTPVADLTWTDATVTADREYGYAVKAFDHAGNASAMSREARARAGLHLRAYLTRSGDATRVALEWSGAETPMVDIRRNGATIATVANDSAWSDEAPAGTGIYQVCEPDAAACTNEARISLTSRRHGVRR